MVHYKLKYTINYNVNWFKGGTLELLGFIPNSFPAQAEVAMSITWATMDSFSTFSFFKL